MEIQDFKEWCARRDPLWFLKDADELAGWVALFMEEEGSDGDVTQKYFWLADISLAQKQAQKPQLMLL